MDDTSTYYECWRRHSIRLVRQPNNVRIRVGRPMSTEIYVNGELLEYGVQPQATVPQNIVIEYRKE